MIILSVAVFGTLGSAIWEESYNIGFDAVIVLAIEYLLIAAGIFVIVTGKKYSKTYICVFEGYIQGEGLINFSRGSFSLEYGKVTSVFFSKDKLIINSSGVLYKIGVSENEASKIAKYINDKI